jgi:hypothetical protein
MQTLGICVQYLFHLSRNFHQCGIKNQIQRFRKLKKLVATFVHIRDFEGRFCF